jgi:hypothetical protein
MKKLFLSFAFLVLITISSFAQLEKGSWIGGVNGNLSIAGRSSGTQYLSWSFNPYAMYLVSKNLAVGIEMDNGFTHYKGSYQDGAEAYMQKGMYYRLQLAPAVRKYFGSGKVRPFVGLSTGLIMEHMHGYSGSDEQTNTETGFGYYLAPQAGISWWMNDKVFMDLKASYNLMDAYFGYNTMDIKIGVGIKIGK